MVEKLDRCSNHLSIHDLIKNSLSRLSRLIPAFSHETTGHVLADGFAAVPRDDRRVGFHKEKRVTPIAPSSGQSPPKLMINKLYLRPLDDPLVDAELMA